MQNVGGYPDSVIGFVLGARGTGTLIGFFFMIYASRFDPRVRRGESIHSLGLKADLVQVAFPQRNKIGVVFDDEDSRGGGAAAKRHPVVLAGIRS